MFSGYDIGDKRLVEIKPPSFKVGIVYMLNRANLYQLDMAVKCARKNLTVIIFDSLINRP